MAFAHIISLLNTIQFHFLQPLPCLIFDDTEMVESLCEKIRNLQGFLEESHKNNIISNQARRVLESKIRGVAHDAEGWIESELHRLYMRFNNEFRENPGSIITNDDFPGPSSGASQRERRWIRTVTRKEEYPVNRTEEDPVNLPKREKNIKERPVKPSQSLYQALQQVKRRLESIERRFQIERNSNHSAEPQRRNTIENIKAASSDPKACRWISSQIIRDLDLSITRASKEIRSILYFTNEFKWTYLSPKPFTCLKLLRVLDIRLCLMDGIPSEIVNLVHLRYLALRNDSVLNLQWLKLQSLQTVIINTFDDSESYWGSMLHVLDMPRLRHVYLPKSCFLNLPKLVQGNLQTIFWLSLPQRLRTKLGFKTIPNVKELGIYIKDKDPYKLLPGSLADLCRLENLKIAVEEDIFFRGEFRLPLAFPSSLKKLKLIYTYLPWEDMAIIGTLPNLEVLKLMGYAFCGQDWRTENGFYKLKHLQIVESDLKHWTVIVDHFPILECLILSCCENLEEFPSAFADITTLQLIKLTRCCSSIVTSAKQIQEERLGLGDNKFVVRDFRTVFGR
nr:putative late blight resistance protein homolog R1B-14 [Ipomoea batatas]